MNESLSKNGMFDTPVGNLHGRLTLDPDNSLLELWDTSYHWNFDKITALPPMQGILEDQRHVYLEFAWARVRTAIGTGGQTNLISLFPLLAVVGTVPFNREISRISFEVDDGAAIFYDRKAFGQLSRADPEKLRMMLAEDDVDLDINDVEVSPRISYWTGKRKILSTDTSFGRVSVRNAPTFSMTSETPVSGVTNHVVVSVDFSKPVTEAKELGKILLRLTRFLGIIAGRPQNIVGLRIVGDGDYPSFWDTYLPTFPRRPEKDENEKPTRRDPLVDAARDSDDFSRLMAGWFKNDDARHRAYSRFFNGWSNQRSYNDDRLIGAANMFDLLPEDAQPPVKPLPPELLQGIAECRRILKEIPGSEKRNGLLGYIGQLSRASLKEKIKYRAESIGHGLPEINFVIDAAVNLRNLYVHGPRRDRTAPAVSGNTLIFLTQTLEFIFGVAELHESGWRFYSWRQGPLSGAHPFAYYLAGYAKGLAQLKEDLGETEAGRMSKELTPEEEQAFREAKLGTLKCRGCGEPLMDAKVEPPARGTGRFEDMVHYRVTCKNCGHLHRIG